VRMDSPSSVFGVGLDGDSSMLNFEFGDSSLLDGVSSSSLLSSLSSGGADSPMGPGLEQQSPSSVQSPSVSGRSTPRIRNINPRSMKNSGVVYGSGLLGLTSTSIRPSNLEVPMTPFHESDSTGKFTKYEKREQSVLPQSAIPSHLPPLSATLTLDIDMPTLQNIVSTVNLGVKLDLKKIALHARNAEFNPKRFAAVVMRIREPRTTALIFSSGKMVCTGAKSEEGSRLAARKFARIVQKIDFPVTFTEFKIQNMVGSSDVRFPIQLEGLCVTHPQFSTYEPELFPGLIYRMVKPRVVLLIFVSGKVVITGAKCKKEIDEAFTKIYPILRGFKK
ncbi:hypothetical protein PMAYCL1PPCAC_31513, partial [Pristionchus mayeri]